MNTIARNWRTNRRRILGAGLAASIAFGAAGGIALTLLGDGSPASGFKKATDAAAILMARGPGERLVAELFDKKSEVASKAARPTERVLARSVKPTVPLVSANDLPVVDMFELPTVHDFALLSPLPPTLVAEPGQFGVAPPLPIGDFPIVNPPLNPPITNPPVSSVPEPSTWLTMLIGFGMIGRSIRRRRQSSGPPLISNPRRDLTRA